MAGACCPPSTPNLKSFIALTPKGILSGHLGGGDILVPSHSTAHTMQRNTCSCSCCSHSHLPQIRSAESEQ